MQQEQRQKKPQQQQQQTQQQQQSAMAKLVGLIKDEASFLPRLAKERVSLPVLCHTSAGGVRPATLRLLFGVPCCLMATNRRLFGHLLLGFAQPRLLCLAKAEQSALLSGADGPDHGKLRILRIVKFLLSVGQQLSLDKREIGRADTQLSFLAGCAVREALRKFDADDGTAFFRANFAGRLADTLDWLLDKSRAGAYFGPDWEFASVSKRPLPPSTLALLACARSRSDQQVDELLDCLLQYHKAKELLAPSPSATKQTEKLVARIDKAVKAVMTAAGGK